MKSEFVPPSRLAGFEIGSVAVAKDFENFIENPRTAEGLVEFALTDPFVVVGVDGTRIVYVAVRDECWFRGRNIIGLSKDLVIELLGLSVLEIQGQTVEAVSLSGGVDLFVSDGVVTLVQLADWDLITE